MVAAHQVWLVKTELSQLYGFYSLVYQRCKSIHYQNCNGNSFRIGAEISYHQGDECYPETKNDLAGRFDRSGGGICSHKYGAQHHAS